MKDISDLIEYENENSNLDFKAIQYKKAQYEAFLKDIMSMANSLSKDDKYIITGVKHKTNGDRELLGITEDFIDEATYQQLFDANIEPHIDFNYFPYEYNDKQFGVFHIRNCTDQPYMMKKNYSALKTGECYIRKGSFQKPLTRKDLDNQQTALKKNDISKDIKVSLKEDELVYQLILEKKEIILLSAIKRKEIEKIIQRKEHELRDKPRTLHNFFPSGLSSMYGSSYESRDLPTLKNNLENIEQTYREHDEYYINEKFAYKINFYIHNISNEFLEDSAIEIIFPKSDNYIVRNDIYSEPYSSHPIISTSPPTVSWEELNYPSVERKDDYYRIYEEIGNVKHQLPTPALKVALRVVNLTLLNSFTINIQVKVFAKNIENPIIQQLQITI